MRLLVLLLILPGCVQVPHEDAQSMLMPVPIEGALYATEISGPVFISWSFDEPVAAFGVYLFGIAEPGLLARYEFGAGQLRYANGDEQWLEVPEYTLPMQKGAGLLVLAVQPFNQTHIHFAIHEREPAQSVQDHLANVSVAHVAPSALGYQASQYSFTATSAGYVSFSSHAQLTVTEGEAYQVRAVAEPAGAFGFLELAAHSDGTLEHSYNFHLEKAYRQEGRQIAPGVATGDAPNLWVQGDVAGPLEVDLELLGTRSESRFQATSFGVNPAELGAAPLPTTLHRV